MGATFLSGLTPYLGIDNAQLRLARTHERNETISRLGSLPFSPPNLRFSFPLVLRLNMSAKHDSSPAWARRPDLRRERQPAARIGACCLRVDLALGLASF